MAQVTIYLKDDLLADAPARAAAAGKSLSAYLAELLEKPRRREWSPEFLATLERVRSNGIV